MEMFSFHSYLNIDLSSSFNIPTTWLFQNYTTCDRYEALLVMTVNQGTLVMIYLGVRDFIMAL